MVNETAISAKRFNTLTKETSTIILAMPWLSNKTLENTQKTRSSLPGLLGSFCSQGADL